MSKSQGKSPEVGHQADGDLEALRKRVEKIERDSAAKDRQIEELKEQLAQRDQQLNVALAKLDELRAEQDSHKRVGRFATLMASIKSRFSRNKAESEPNAGMQVIPIASGSLNDSDDIEPAGDGSDDPTTVLGGSQIGQLKPGEGMGQIEPGKDNGKRNKHNRLSRGGKVGIALGAIAVVGTLIFCGVKGCSADFGNAGDSQQASIEDASSESGSADQDSQTDSETSSSTSAGADQDLNDTKKAAATEQLHENQAYTAAASAMNMNVDTVKALANAYGVPADKLGTIEAQQYMRDNLSVSTNVSESLNSDYDTKDVLKFQAYNNPGVLAMYMNGINEEAKGPDSGVDGLEMPADAAALYDLYQMDNNARQTDFNTLCAKLDNATVTQREATTKMTYSYFISQDNKLIVCYGPENSNGYTTIIYQVTCDDGTRLLIKNGCAQIEAGKYVPVTPVVTTTSGKKSSHQSYTKAAGGHGSSSTSKTTNKPTPNNNGDQPGPEKLQPKDSTDNDPQQDAANGENGKSYFNDDAKADTAPQQYVDNSGQAISSDQQKEARQNAGNTDGDATNGGEYVPADNNGQITGSQGDKAPAEQDWTN